MPPLPSPVQARPLVRLPSRHRAVRGRPQPGAPPAGPPARERQGDGAPPPASRRAPPPPQLRWPGDGARRAAEASRGTRASCRFPGEGRGGGRGASPPGPPARPRYSGESSSTRAASPSRRCPGAVRPAPLPGRRQRCSAGKLTCARAPPLLAGRLLARPDAGRGGGVAERPAPPPGRICLPPKARVLAVTLPCFGGLSQAPRNISYREPRQEGPRRRRLPGPSLASASSWTHSRGTCAPPSFLTPDPGISP